MTTPTATQTAQEVIAMAKAGGATLSQPGEGVLCVSIKINGVEEFGQAESLANSILHSINQTQPGSVWGTDGASIGGMVAIQTGNFRLCRSGLSLRVLSAITKELSA